MESNDLIFDPDGTDAYEPSPEELAAAAEAAARAERLLTLQLIVRMQQQFPIPTYPFEAISKEFGVTERNVYDLSERLFEQEAIERIGATFDPARIGYVSALCAMPVEAEDVDGVKAAIAAIPGIARAVECDSERRVWFMIAEASKKKLDKQLAELANKTGYDIEVFRPTHVFKSQTTLEVDPTVPKRLERPAAPVTLATVKPAALSDIDRQIARVLQGDISGEHRPYSSIARMTADTCGEHLSEEEVMRRITRWCDSGVIRRLGAELNPAKFGYTKCVIATWNVSEKVLPVLAAVLAAQPETTRVLAKVGDDVTLGNIAATFRGRSDADIEEAFERIAGLLAKADIDAPECQSYEVARNLKNASTRYFFD